MSGTARRRNGSCRNSGGCLRHGSAQASRSAYSRNRSPKGRFARGQRGEGRRLDGTDQNSDRPAGDHDPVEDGGNGEAEGPARGGGPESPVRGEGVEVPV